MTSRIRNITNLFVRINDHAYATCNESFMVTNHAIYEIISTTQNVTERNTKKRLTKSVGASPRFAPDDLTMVIVTVIW